MDKQLLLLPSYLAVGFICKVLYSVREEIFLVTNHVGKKSYSIGIFAIHLILISPSAMLNFVGEKNTVPLSYVF